MEHILRSIVGDTKYGEGRHNRLFRERLNAHRLLLMAVGIEFQHPAPGQRMRIEAGVGRELEALFGRLGWTRRPGQRQRETACADRFGIRRASCLDHFRR